MSVKEMLEERRREKKRLEALAGTGEDKKEPEQEQTTTKKLSSIEQGTRRKGGGTHTSCDRKLEHSQDTEESGTTDDTDIAPSRESQGGSSVIRVLPDESSPFEYFPSELVLEIFSWLSVKDLYYAALAWYLSLWSLPKIVFIVFIL
jgi:hypothetical protein